MKPSCLSITTVLPAGAGHKKTPFSFADKKRLKQSRALLIFPTAASDASWIWHLDERGRAPNRLPWCHRASPSTTLNETADPSGFATEWRRSALVSTAAFSAKPATLGQLRFAAPEFDVLHAVN